MSLLRRGMILMVVAGFLLLSASSAWAYTAVGDDGFAPDTSCLGDTFLQTGVASGLSYTVPTAGVITRWGYHDANPIVSGLKLKVARLSLAGATILGDDAAPGLRGINQINGPYAVRIPVQTGDVIGIYTTGSGPCSLSTGNTSDAFVNAAGDLATGTTTAVSAHNSFKFPVEAYVEADADGDAYGDQSQDFCDTDPTTQGPCRSPGSLTFTPQAVGTRSSTQIVTLSNTALPEYLSTAVSISSISAGGDFVVASNGCGGSIAPGASCEVGVAFAPKGVGGQAGALSIADSANGSPQVVPLQGTSLGCVVPNLKHKKLKTVRGALSNAGCSLGRVRGHGRKVRKQSVAPGTVLFPGAPVNVKLGS